MKRSKLELIMAANLQAAKGIPPWVEEHAFAKPRRWRFDFCWPDKMLALEVEGGTWTGGRHMRPGGFVKDCEKYTEAMLLGWHVIRAPTPWVMDGTALVYVKRALIELAP